MREKPLLTVNKMLQKHSFFMKNITNDKSFMEKSQSSIKNEVLPLHHIAIFNPEFSQNGTKKAVCLSSNLFDLYIFKRV